MRILLQDCRRRGLEGTWEGEGSLLVELDLLTKGIIVNFKIKQNKIARRSKSNLLVCRISASLLRALKEDQSWQMDPSGRIVRLQAPVWLSENLLSQPPKKHKNRCTHHKLLRCPIELCA